MEQLVASAEAAVEEVLRRGVSFIAILFSAILVSSLNLLNRTLNVLFLLRWLIRIKLLLEDILMVHS